MSYKVVKDIIVRRKELPFCGLKVALSRSQGNDQSLGKKSTAVLMRATEKA